LKLAWEVVQMFEPSTQERTWAVFFNQLSPFNNELNRKYDPSNNGLPASWRDNLREDMKEKEKKRTKRKKRKFGRKEKYLFL
jgi:hypothetical protein